MVVLIMLGKFITFESWNEGLQLIMKCSFFWVCLMNLLDFKYFVLTPDVSPQTIGPYATALIKLFSMRLSKGNLIFLVNKWVELSLFT